MINNKSIDNEPKPRYPVGTLIFDTFDIEQKTPYIIKEYTGIDPHDDVILLNIILNEIIKWEYQFVDNWCYSLIEEKKEI